MRNVERLAQKAPERAEERLRRRMIAGVGDRDGLRATVVIGEAQSAEREDDWFHSLQSHNIQELERPLWWEVVELVSTKRQNILFYIKLTQGYSVTKLYMMRHMTR